MDREPLVTTASVTSVVTAVIGLAAAFGFGLTDTQTAAVLGVGAVVAPLVVALVARRKVTPVEPAPRRRRVRRDTARADLLYVLWCVVLALAAIALLVWLA